MSLITIKSDALTVVISSRGAELQSIRDSQGFERMWQGDPAYWTGRAPILFPVAGGLRDNCYTMDGERYEMPKHGFVRQREWQVEEAGERSATFLMRDKHPGFPFDYELRAIFAVDGSSLSVTYRVTNCDSRAFWFGLGAHEAYATPGGLESYSIEFEQPERLDDYVLEGNLIGRTPRLMGENVKVFPMKTEYFAVDALVFPTLRSRSVTLSSTQHDRRIRVDYPEHSVLMLWTKPGAEYLCIEPWINAPDFTDSDMQIEHKPGCIRLKPGETVERTHTITAL